ncbi:hypothetical protein GTL21_004918 [Salmonella enterica]|nr:hypothetical protein [Salmonella enterica]
MDTYEATTSAYAYAGKAAYALTEREDASLGADPVEGIVDLDEAVVSMEIPFGDLKEVIRQAYQSGVDKGREQGGLEPLFKGEV